MILPLLVPVVAYQDANPILTSRKEAVVSYLTSHLDTNGNGFSENDANPDLATTYRAITSLSLLGVLSELSFAQTVTWIDEFRNTTNGGYSLDKNNLNDVSIYATSYAMGSLITIGRSDKVQSEVVSYINSLQNVDGGYGNKLGNESTITYTFLALRALKSYNSMANIDNATAYLWTRQNNDSLDDNYGAFITDISQISYTILSSWYAVNGLYQILQNNVVTNNTDALINWIKDCQNLEFNTADRGGISNNPIESSSQMIYGCAAAGVVSLLNRKSDLDISLRTWILNQQNEDGGFSSSSSTELSSVSTTYYAILALYYIDGNLNSLLSTVPWQDIPEFSVVLIISLIVIAAIIVAIFIKRRYY